MHFAIPMDTNGGARSALGKNDSFAMPTKKALFKTAKQMKKRRKLSSTGTPTFVNINLIAPLIPSKHGWLQSVGGTDFGKENIGAFTWFMF